MHLTKAGGNVQLYQTNVSLKPDTTYRLSFAAKSSNGEDMSVAVHKHNYPYTHYGLTNYEVDLTPEWTWHDIEFTTRGFNEPVNDARVRFWFGPYDVDGMTYSIDHVLLHEADGYAPPLPPAPDPPPAPPEGHCDLTPGNVLVNPGFETGTTPWRFYSDGTGWFKTEPPGYECDRTSRIKIVEPGNNVQLYQKEITLESDTTYRLRLAAKSTSGRDLELFLHRHTSPYTKYGLNGVVLDLSEEWQVFQVQFTTSGFDSPVNDARLRFSLGDRDVAGEMYYIDDVVLIQAEDLAVGAAATTVTAAETGKPVNELVAGLFIDDNDRRRLEDAPVPEGNPPVCAGAYANPAKLWPANHKFVDVAIEGVTDPDGDDFEVVVTSITQDEPVSAEAAAVIGDGIVQLRAEQNDAGGGRVYEIAFDANDATGEMCSGRVFVAVPHDEAEDAGDSGDEQHRILMPFIR